MIANIKILKSYCSEYTQIENYAEAVKSPLKYDLHHRLEISENKSRKDLIDENLYYGRPPEELIFLEHREHVRLHNANRSDETRQRMSEAQKGHLVSEDTRKRMSNAKKNMSEDTRKKISENNSRYWRGKPGTCLGRHWHLENGKRVYTD